MNILILGVNGDIGSSIFNKIYNSNNKFYLVYSKKKPKYNYNYKNIEYFKIDFKNNIYNSNVFKKIIKNKYDVVINNVGDSNPYISIFKLQKKDLLKSFNINFFSPFYIVSEIIKKNIKLNKKLKIINISSNTIKFLGSKNNFSYYLSKLTLDNALLYFSKHFAEKKIRVNILRPGLIKTKKTTKLKNYNSINFKNREKLVPFGRSGLPKDISSVIDFLLSDQADFIYGQVISISGGE